MTSPIRKIGAIVFSGLSFTLSSFIGGFLNYQNALSLYFKAQDFWWATDRASLWFFTLGKLRSSHEQLYCANSRPTAFNDLNCINLFVFSMRVSISSMSIGYLSHSPRHTYHGRANICLQSARVSSPRAQSVVKHSSYGSFGWRPVNKIGIALFQVKGILLHF